MTYGGLNIRLRPSRCFLAAGLALHGMALAAVWLSALPWPGLVAVSVMVCGSLCWFLTRQRKPAFTRMLSGEGMVMLSGPGGELPASPPSVGFMACGVLLLRFRYRRAGQRERAVHLLLLPDSLAPCHRQSLYRYLGGWADECLMS
ncbi:MAG: protein YgfX [Pseudohongiellaceae bacterium]